MLSFRDGESRHRIVVHMNEIVIEKKLKINWQITETLNQSSELARHDDNSTMIHASGQYYSMNDSDIK